MAEETAKAPGAVQQKNRTLALPPARYRDSQFRSALRETTAAGGALFLLDSAQAEPNSEGLFDDRRVVLCRVSDRQSSSR